LTEEHLEGNWVRQNLWGLLEYSRRLRFNSHGNAKWRLFIKSSGISGSSSLASSLKDREANIKKSQRYSLSNEIKLWCIVCFLGSFGQKGKCKTFTWYFAENIDTKSCFLYCAYKEQQA